MSDIIDTQVYEEVRGVLELARQHAFSAVNFAMVEAYWSIGKLISKTINIIKDPYVLEFLGLNHNTHHFESDVEQALISHIQKFLLELGRGFTFEAR
jgi:predicted nuclease of restriction endonuclease-like (RecB) superfamily